MDEAAQYEAQAQEIRAAIALATEEAAKGTTGSHKRKSSSLFSMLGGGNKMVIEMEKVEEATESAKRLETLSECLATQAELDVEFWQTGGGYVKVCAYYVYIPYLKEQQ